MLSSPSSSEGGPRASLTSSAAALALGSLFTQLAQIVTLGVIARTVAKDQVATYQQLNLLYGIVAPMLLAGIPTALLYFVPRAGTRDERNAWITRAFLLLGATGLAAAVAVVAAREPLAAVFNNEGLASALAWYAPYLFFAFVAAVAPPALTASDHVRSAALLNAFVGVSTMACVVVAATVRPTGTGLAMALSASGALLAVASVSVVRRSTESTTRSGCSPMACRWPPRGWPPRSVTSSTESSSVSRSPRASSPSTRSAPSRSRSVC